MKKKKKKKKKNKNKNKNISSFNIYSKLHLK